MLMHAFKGILHSRILHRTLLHICFNYSELLYDKKKKEDSKLKFQPFLQLCSRELLVGSGSCENSLG